MSFTIQNLIQSLHIKVDPAVPNAIVGDEQRLAQVLTNLLANAVKFTPEEGTIFLTVQNIARQNASNLIRVTVKDTGIGISPEQQARLFSSFEQADGGISRKFGGTGLGLVISKNIIDMMGGTIWIESELGKGASFIFDIEVKRAHTKAQKTLVAKDPLRVLADDADKSGWFDGFRVLLAEDIDINREIVYSLLEDTGLHIESAENGAEVINKFLNNPEDYHLILMDIHMPEVDGYEATRRIRTLDFPYAKQIPILAMTANVFREDIEKCLDVGMNDHLGKPIDADELVIKLKKYLTRL